LTPVERVDQAGALGGSFERREGAEESDFAVGSGEQVFEGAQLPREEA
jgi:hypothetical protein